MNNKFNEANLIPRMAQIVLNSQEMKDIKEKIEAVGDDVESILDDMESILNGVSTRFPDHVLAKEGDDMKLVSISRLIELMAIYQLDPLKEDPSRIWFEIDVATLGDFRMSFSGGRAWLDTTELTSNVAVPNVVGKHVVVIEDTVGSIIILDNRLQGVLNTGEYTGGLYLGVNHMLTQIIAPKAISINRSDYIDTTPNNTLTSIIAPVAAEVNAPFNKALTELYAPNANKAIRVYSCTALEDITCPAVYNTIEGQATAFTAATIAKLLRQSVESGWTEHNVPNDGILLLMLEQEYVKYSVTTVGTNAPYSEWSQQAKDDLEILLQRGWIVSYTE